MYHEYVPYQIEFIPKAPFDFQDLGAGELFEKDFATRFEAIKEFLDRDDIMTFMLSMPPRYGTLGSLTEDPNEPDRLDGLVDIPSLEGETIRAHVPPKVGTFDDDYPFAMD